jgi:hypothetical protein
VVVAGQVLLVQMEHQVKAGLVVLEQIGYRLELFMLAVAVVHPMRLKAREVQVAAARVQNTTCQPV